MKTECNLDSIKIVKQALSFETPDRLPVYENFWLEFEQIWREKYNLPESEKIENNFSVDLKVPAADETLFPSKKGEKAEMVITF